MYRKALSVCQSQSLEIFLIRKSLSYLKWASVWKGWCFFRGRGCFHVSGERGVPAGGAGEYPEVLLDGKDYYEGRGGVSVRV